MTSLKRAVLAYMSTRCQVSSQHKLPTKEELFSTVTLGFLWKKQDIDKAIEELLTDEKLVAYGPYLSDHVIDVL